MGRVFLILPTLGILLSGCGMADAERQQQERLEQNAAAESFGPDAASGEILARHTDSEGVTTSMRAGTKGAVPLPKPFVIYPNSKVIEATLVERGEGRAVTVNFAVADERDTVVEFYRQLAHRAQIAPNVDINAENAATLAGRSANGRLYFTLHVDQQQDQTRGQLSVSSGMD